MQRLVIIGGTGHFGGRICRRIAGEENIELVVTSRSEEKAQEFVDELRSIHPNALIGAAGLDQVSPEFDTDLKALCPDLVIHTAGPYQGQNYRVAKACIEAGSHYIDLADGSGNAVRIGSDGWEIETPPIKFCRPPGMRPLPTPKRPNSKADCGKLAELLKHESESDLRLLLTLITAAMRPAGHV